MDENQFWVCVWAVILSGAVVIIGLCQTHVTQRVKMFTDAGYTQAMLPGSGIARWVKP